MPPSNKRVPTIRFSGFVEEWRPLLIDQMGDVVGGGTPNTANPIYWNGSIRWFTPSEVGHEKYVKDSKRMITPLGLQRSSAKLLPAETILLSTRATIGECSITRYPCATNQGFQSVVISKEFDKDFCYYVILTKKEEMKGKASGSTFLEISNKEVRQIECKVPILKEQNKISSLLSAFDKLIELRKNKLDKLIALKRELLNKLFPQQGQKIPAIRFSGFEKEWKEKKFADTVMIERGGSPRPIEAYVTHDTNGLNWVKIGDAPEFGNYITQTAEKIRPEGLKKTREVHPDDLILSNSMSFGRPYIMKITGCIHDGWLLIRNNRKIFDLHYLCYMLSTNVMLCQYEAMAAGSTVHNLNKELVGNTFINYPEINEQARIGQFFRTLDNLIELRKKEVDKMTALKKELLNKLFVG